MTTANEQEATLSPLRPPEAGKMTAVSLDSVPSPPANGEDNPVKIPEKRAHNGPQSAGNAYLSNPVVQNRDGTVEG